VGEGDAQRLPDQPVAGKHGAVVVEPHPPGGGDDVVGGEAEQERGDHRPEGEHQEANDPRRGEEVEGNGLTARLCQAEAAQQESLRRYRSCFLRHTSALHGITTRTDLPAPQSLGWLMLIRVPPLTTMTALHVLGQRPTAVLAAVRTLYGRYHDRLVRGEACGPPGHCGAAPAAKAAWQGTATEVASGRYADAHSGDTTRTYRHVGRHFNARLLPCDF